MIGRKITSLEELLEFCEKRVEIYREQIRVKEELGIRDDSISLVYSKTSFHAYVDIVALIKGEVAIADEDPK